MRRLNKNLVLMGPMKDVWEKTRLLEERRRTRKKYAKRSTIEVFPTFKRVGLGVDPQYDQVWVGLKKKVKKRSMEQLKRRGLNQVGGAYFELQTEIKPKTKDCTY